MIKRKPESTTLEALSLKYLKSLERGGWSLGTCFSYAAELKVAQDELGKDTLIGDITSAQVAKYFASTRVCKLRSGKAKAQVSVLKTQRVLRLALVWGAEQGYLEVAPIPEEPKAAPEPAKAKGKKGGKTEEPAQEPKPAAKKRGSKKAITHEVTPAVPQAEAEAAADVAGQAIATESPTGPKAE